MAAVDFRVSADGTTVMSDYHICKYDPILGVFIFVGSEASVLVVGKDLTRRLLPLMHHGTHWLDCFIYAGTTTFLLLAPEALVCVDYGTRGEDSMLSSPNHTAAFTYLHLPTGLTCGAVGHKNGIVSYFHLQPATDETRKRSQIAWTAVSTNVRELCGPFVEDVGALGGGPSNEAAERFFVPGSVLSMDSYPENPNAFVGVVAGVPGVCKWYVDEGRLSCFFDARCLAVDTDGILVTCKITPGGMYVVAATLYATKVIVWCDKTKKRNKIVDLYWTVDLSESITRGVQQSSSSDPFWYNEYRVGIHMARATLDGVPSTDKHSHMYLLIHGQSDIVEIVLWLELKQVVRREQVIAYLNAYTAATGDVAAAKEQPQKARRCADDTDAEGYFKIFHVEPCAISKYWASTLTYTDLQALLITSSSGLKPILAKRSQETGGIESLQEIRELSASAAWFPRAILLRLPAIHTRALAVELQRVPPHSLWEQLLRGGDALLPQALSETEVCDSAGHSRTPLWRGVIFATVTDAAQAVCLSPQTNEIFAVNSTVLQNCTPWETLAMAQDAATLVLEEALPALDVAFLPNEIILRVYSTESSVMAMKFDIRRNGGALLWNLDSAALHLESSTRSDSRLVRKAIVVDARLEPSSTNSAMSIYQTGKSLLLLLRDSSIALVDLSGAKSEDEKPFMILIPPELTPVDTTSVCIEAFWASNASAGAAVDGKIFCVVCLFTDGKGFLVFNLSNMRIVTYQQPSYLLNATELRVTNALTPLLPNFCDEIQEFEVTLEAANIPDEVGEYGEVVCSDALGVRVFTLMIGFGLSADDGGWCFRVKHAPLKSEKGPKAGSGWVSINSSASVLQITFNISADGTTLDWLVGGHTGDAQPAIQLPGTIVDVSARWHLGRAEFSYSTPTGDLCSQLLNPDLSPANCNLSEKTSSGPRKECSPITIAFISRSEITLVNVTALLSAQTSFPLRCGNASNNSSFSSGGLPMPVACRIDPARRLDSFHVLRRRGALLVITCDTNGWRWINILDSQTAKPRMQGHATLDFVGEEHLHVLTVEINNVLHLYMLGMDSGVVGHFCIETTLGVCNKSIIIEREAFPKPRYQTVPSNYRAYARFIPPIPTLKQERGFFERLLTVPWEDVAQKLEFETFHRVQSSTSEAPRGSSDPAVRSSKAKPITKPRTEIQASREELDASNRAQKQQEIRLKEREELLQSNARATSDSAPPAGSRYLQLKAIAKRENVSLTEARRLMSEGMRKLQERGEKLNQIESRSRELAQSALTFQQLATQLKEKTKSSWL